MRFSESTKNLFKALSDFKADYKQPKKDANNPFFKSKYVPLENVVYSIDEVAPKHGLSYIQSTINDENGKTGVITLLTHSSGEWLECDPLYLKPDKNTPQGMGSAITYARRYSLSSAFGVASEVDDDGNEASGNTKKRGNSQKQIDNLNATMADIYTDFEPFKISKKTFCAGINNRLGSDYREHKQSELLAVAKTWLEELRNEG